MEESKDTIRCSSCDLRLPIAQFSIRRWHPNNDKTMWVYKKHKRCKSCISKKHKIWRSLHPEYHREYMSGYREYVKTLNKKKMK
jgi:hypothetical protein